jgi:hypothetical protein
VAAETNAPKVKDSVAEKLKQLTAPVAAKSAASVAVKSDAQNVVKELVAVPVAVKTVAQKLKDLSAPVAVKELVAAPVAVKTVAQKLKDLSAPVAVKSNAPKDVKELVAAPVATETDAPKVVKDSDNFTIVRSKNSKKGIVPQITTMFIADKPDDFPSLGTPASISPIGFWGSGKNPIEIAKEVAKKPSPPPTRSPQLNTSIREMGIRAGGGSFNSTTDEEEEDYLTDSEIMHQKNRSSDPDSYWR